jgi:tetratricopeptide (TPR) repeat protein
MIKTADLAGRYYRLGLAAAKRRDLSSALRYAEIACALSASYQGDTVDHSDMLQLVKMCRYELGEEAEEGLLQVKILAGQKKWWAAAKAAQGLSHQSARLLAIQGCLWVLAKRYARAMDCFARALAKDRGNKFAADALIEIGRRRMYFWRFF